MKKVYLSLLLFAVCMCATAQKRSSADAYEAALSFVKNKTNKAKQISEATKPITRGVGDKDYYIYNVEDNQGFVIVSGDERAETIIGYADSGSLEYDKMPPSMKAWLEGISLQLSKLPKTNTTQRRANAATTRFADIAPLVETQWNQISPYNSQLPVVTADNGYDYGAYYTGCVPTAMAQVMNYHKYPAVGVGHKTSKVYYKFESDGSYWWNTAKQSGYNCEVVFDADFANTHYDWANMKASYSSDDDKKSKEVVAVATLMKHCGIAANTTYGLEYSDGSSTGYLDALDALVNNFRYASSAHIVEKSDYTSSSWEKMLYTELTAKRPVICTGSNSKGGVGHAFICDGYMFNIYTGGYFHFNWGWGGYGDGYFKSSALIIDEESQYDIDLCAMIGIQPIVNVTSITLSESSVQLRSGSDMRLTATLLPVEASGMKVVWTSSNENVVSVEDDGTLHAKSEGKAVVTASTVDGDVKRASCNVQVVGLTKPVEVLLLNATELKMNVNGTATLRCTVQPEDATNKTLRWTSSNESVAKVDRNGSVKALGEGNAVITVESSDGSEIVEKCVVHVQNAGTPKRQDITDYDPADDIGKVDKPIVSGGLGKLIIQLRNGKTVVYALSEEPKMTFIGREFSVKTSDYTIGYNSSDILRYTFDLDEVTDIQKVVDAKDNNLVIEDGKLLLSRFAAKQTVEVFDVSGTLIVKGETNDEGALTLPLPKGKIVIVKCNDIITKLILR